jgi:uncharacterized RDD family membrane protein YckC
VAAYLIDWVILGACTIPLFVGLALVAAATTGDTGATAVGAVLMIVGIVLPFAFWVWNYWREGTTGWTLGKQALGLQVRRAANGALLGGWLSIGRQILHAVDGALCYLGYLWPLWDDKRQTFADKIVDTVVVRVLR